jgi:WhiB family redox-sensing transcriptional regulator
MSWRDRAACRAEDPELFFPVGTGAAVLEQVHRAKRICARCEVREECLQLAVDSGRVEGVWGGLFDRELRREVNRRRRARQAV